MKKSLFASIISAFLFSTASFAGVIDMQFSNPTYLDGNKFEVTVQVKAQDVDFEIGHATVFFDYNPAAITAPAYQSINFNEKNECALDGTQAAYHNSFNYSEKKKKGEGNYAILINAPKHGCPTVGKEWVDVAKFTFNVVDASKDHELNFNKRFTGFNTVVNNGQMHDVGNLTALKGTVANSVPSTSANVNVYPNITQDAVNIDFNLASDSKVNITVYDMTGKTITTDNFSATSGNSSKKVDLSKYGNGYYLVEFEANNQKNSQKVLLTK